MRTVYLVPGQVFQVGHLRGDYLGVFPHEGPDGTGQWRAGFAFTGRGTLSVRRPGHPPESFAFLTGAGSGLIGLSSRLSEGAILDLRSAPVRRLWMGARALLRCDKSVPNRVRLLVMDDQSEGPWTLPSGAPSSSTSSPAARSCVLATWC